MRRGLVLGMIGIAIATAIAIWLALIPRPHYSANAVRGRGSSFRSKDFYEATVLSNRGRQVRFTCRVEAIAHGVRVASGWFTTPLIDEGQTYRAAGGMVPGTEPWVPTSSVDHLAIACSDAGMRADAAR
jgi:hypothetical protein